MWLSIQMILERSNFSTTNTKSHCKDDTLEVCHLQFSWKIPHQLSAKRLMWRWTLAEVGHSVLRCADSVVNTVTQIWSYNMMGWIWSTL